MSARGSNCRRLGLLHPRRVRGCFGDRLGRDAQCKLPAACVVGAPRHSEEGRKHPGPPGGF